MKVGGDDDKPAVHAGRARVVLGENIQAEVKTPELSKFLPSSAHN